MSGVRWRGARVVVLGLARSGEAAARALLERGASVTVLDSADAPAQRERGARLPGATIVLGRTEPADVEGAELVVASPAVRPVAPWIKAAEAAAIPVWSEIELAWRLGAEPAVAITGTNGKTTTTEMTVAALRAAGLEAVAAGNVGFPLVEALGSGPIVAEVSSFQLHWIDRFRAQVAVLLNVARDHLDWHGSFEAYARAKERIFENRTQGDIAVHHVTCVPPAPPSIPFSEDHLPAGGAGVQDGWIVVPQGPVVEVSRLRARGRPNRADAVAAAAAACALGADPLVAGHALASYESRAHRIEPIGSVAGVTYVNDSKATDPHAALAALEELDRVVLIAGGRNKGLDLSELAEAAPKLRAVIAIGEAAPEVEAAFGDTGVPVEHASTMADAVRRSAARAVEGDTVLLSPACASFDMFTSYEARGDAFRAAVDELRGGRR